MEKAKQKRHGFHSAGYGRNRNKRGAKTQRRKDANINDCTFASLG